MSRNQIIFFFYLEVVFENVTFRLTMSCKLVHILAVLHDKTDPEHNLDNTPRKCHPNSTAQNALHTVLPVSRKWKSLVSGEK